jgi:hypothetical protein
LVAIGLAALGQQAIFEKQDLDLAQRYYLAAAVLFIVSLLHPTLPTLRLGRKRDTTYSEPQSASATEGISTARPLRTRALGERVYSPAAAAAAARGNVLARAWSWWLGLRARLGWWTIAGGLTLTLALAAWAAWVLQRDITDPLGGWLWAASLAALLITFLGARSPGPGLLHGPESDFFGPGLPRVPLRWEATAVAIIMILSAVLRIYNLEYLPGIHGDEGEQGMDIRAIVEGRPTPIFGVGWWAVPNLSFYLWSFTLRIFGDSMFGLRMFSVIAGLLEIVRASCRCRL